MRMNLRRYALLTYKAQNVTARISYLWKFLRKYNDFLAIQYAELVKIAEMKGVAIPEPLVDMTLQKDESKWNKMFGKKEQDDTDNETD
jgi:hypothetical protein